MGGEGGAIERWTEGLMERMGWRVKSGDESEFCWEKADHERIGLRSCSDSLQETQLLSAESEGSRTGSCLVEGRELWKNHSGRFRRWSVRA